MSEKMSVEDFRKLISGTGSGPKKSKMNNTRVEVEGKKYDSKREAKRAGELILLQNAGEITALMEQVKFHFTDESYIADFVYMDRKTGAFIVEDSKGHRTATYVHKRRLMLKYYNIKILET